MKWVVIAHCEAKNNGKMEQFTREIASFIYPHQAKEFIEKCFPQERRSSFEVINRTEETRCEDCKCFELMTSNNQHFCNKFGGYVTENDYCSRAERK